ncbi:hypothetical protein ACFLZ7_01010 [Nanoarchaeota archaeon]
MSLGEAFGLVAPYYNLVFILIVLALFIKLLGIKNRRVYNKPWLLLFIAIIILIVETLMTILRGVGLLAFPSFVFGLFEMGMITLFIYMLLLQKQFIKSGKRG